jgi:processive 1,2-diacylglycerol beta-glucosyltransferase
MRDSDSQNGMGPKKLLLLSVPAGAGHVRVAEAIRAYAAGQGEIEAVHLDAMAYAAPRLRALYTDLYIFLVRRAPGLWRHLYRITDAARPDGWLHRLRRRVEAHESRALLAKVAKMAPDIVVCTHFLPAELLSRQVAAGKLHCKIWVQVTDFDLHRMWLHPHVSGYFAPNEEVAFRMRTHGIPAAAIHVTGIPTMPAFSRLPERAECARALGLDPARTTFLLMGGGAGLGGLSEVARRLLALDGDFQLIVLAGKNAAELAALRRLGVDHPGRLSPQRYTDRVERLMACADLVITKPGGSTTAECLALGLPMIVHAAIPGQEECNANFLLEQGVALKALDLDTLEYRIRHLMDHPEHLAAMRASAKALGRPHAALRVLDTVLRHAESADANL